MIRRYENIKPEDVMGIIAEEKKNIGKFHPVTDTRFRDWNKAVLVKYFSVYNMPYPSENKCITIHCEMGVNGTESLKHPAIMWYTCGEYDFCTESEIIGWLFESEVDEILTN